MDLSVIRKVIRIIFIIILLSLFIWFGIWQIKLIRVDRQLKNIEDELDNVIKEYNIIHQEIVNEVYSNV